MLLFDLGGVLIENHTFSELRRLMDSAHTEAELIEAWLRSPVARQFELGQCSAEQFAESVVRELRLSLPPRDFLAAFKGWPKGFFDGAEPMLSTLRSTHTVCCLSNSNEAHWSDTITQHFDSAFSSHLIGCIKPDHEAFQHVVDRLGVEAGAVYFFDDAPMNVDAAQAVGLNAYHTVGYRNLHVQLTELGFLS